MVDIKTFKELAMAFDEAVELPHFHKASFRVKKKIFATLDIKLQTAVLKLNEIDQSVFSSFDPSVIYPVSGGWGKKGWTVVELMKVEKDILIDALTTSYCTVAPKKLAEKYKPNLNEE